MRSGIAIPVTANKNQITLDATIGIAMFPEHGHTAMDLIQHADLTMYDQKRRQRGSVGWKKNISPENKNAVMTRPTAEFSISIFTVSLSMLSLGISSS